jgi:hypothetical protein
MNAVLKLAALGVAAIVFTAGVGFGPVWANTASKSADQADHSAEI